MIRSVVAVSVVIGLFASFAQAANVVCSRTYGSLQRTSIAHVSVGETQGAEAELLNWDDTKVTVSVQKSSDAVSGEVLVLSAEHRSNAGSYFSVSSYGDIQAGVNVKTHGALSGSGITVTCKGE